MRRVDDDQFVHELRQLIGQVPSHTAAPIVRHQGFQGRCTRFNLNEGCNVLHQEFGTVRRHIRRLAGFFIAP